MSSCAETPSPPQVTGCAVVLVVSPPTAAHGRRVPRATPRRSGISECVHTRRARWMSLCTSIDRILRVGPPFSTTTENPRAVIVVSARVAVCVVMLRAVLRASRWCVTRNRIAPLMRLVRVSSVSTTHAASRSRASCASRTPCTRESAGAPSMTMSENTPLRSKRSAHQLLRLPLCGRMTTNRSPTLAHGAGARVRRASIHATHPPLWSTPVTTCCRSAVLPEPSDPTTSVMRPRWSPPPRAASSGAMRVVHGAPAVRPPATTAWSWLRRAVSAGGAAGWSGVGRARAAVFMGYRIKTESKGNG